MKIEKNSELQGINQNTKKIGGMKSVAQFLKSFNSIGEAKAAIGAMIEELKGSNPGLVKELMKLLAVLDQADKMGMTLDDFITAMEKADSTGKSMDQFLVELTQGANLEADEEKTAGAEASASATVISTVQETTMIFSDMAFDPSKVQQTSSIA